MIKRVTNIDCFVQTSIITGFQLGANDYITKPFKPMELVCRVRNALQKSGKVPSVFQIGKI